MIHAYGAGIVGALGIKLDYAAVCGLYWNIDRLRLVNAVAVYNGLAASKETGLSRAWYDAAAMLDVQVDSMHVETELDRAHAAGVRRYMGGGA